jgi:ABC-type nitrate/sulfonate/bicarbonate transport system permease component
MEKGVSVYLSRLYLRAGKRVIRDLVLGIIALVAFIAIWQFLSTQWNTAYLPPPGSVYNAFIDSFVHTDPSLKVTMWKNIESSMDRFAIGFVLAMLAAIPLGLLIGTSKIGEGLARPIVEIFRPIPPIAWVPFFFIVFGAVWYPILIVFIGVFFPLLSNIVFGVKSVETQLIDAARTLGAKRRHLFVKVILPYSVPFIMAGITIGLGIGWMCIVAAEFFGTSGGGVGTYIITQSSLGRYDYMFAGMAVIAILGMLTVGSARILEKYVSKWMGVSSK